MIAAASRRVRRKKDPAPTPPPSDIETVVHAQFWIEPES
jgi:hypothetical protein